MAERSPAPLRLFGLVEVGIGVLAFGSQSLLAALAPAHVMLQAWLPDTAMSQTLARFAGAFTVLMGVTTLMGMTLPLMLKAASSAGDNAAPSGRRISLLYAVNTAGAVCGVLVTGFFLIGSQGIAASFRIAALTNVLVGGAAVLLWRQTKHSAGSAGLRMQSPPLTSTAAMLPRTALLVFGLSGFAALGLEVVWFRILVYFVPATTYAFSTMLAAVLLGLAAGSFAAMPLIARQKQLLGYLAVLQIATACLVPVTITGLVWAYQAGWHTTADVHVSVILAFPPAFLMGMAYPIGLRAWAAGIEDGAELDAAKVGNLNAANLIGGIVGAVVGGLVVLPALGTRAGLGVLASVYVVTFFLLIGSIVRPRVRRTLAIGSLGLFAAAVLAIPNLVDAATARRYDGSERLLWWKEGAQTTAVVRVTTGGRRVLYLDGLHQASDAPETVLIHRLIGHLPMALHPAPARTIVIGLGGGVTPGAVSQHATQVDIIELSPAVVESASWFSHVNYDVLHAPRVKIRIDDGRNFLLSRAGRYDVVTADLVQPEHAGAGNLYSREYFRLVRAALAPGGLALQWIGQRPEAEYKLILRTFLEVFPEATLWADGHLLVGSVSPLTIQRDAFERHLQHGPTLRALEEVGLGGFQALLDMYVTGPEELRAFVGSGPVLTDDRPLVEYFKSLPKTGRGAINLSIVKGDVTRHVR
jgi:spermidine synthase